MERSVRHRLIALAMAGMLAAMPAGAATGRMASPESVNWGKALDYAMCTAGIAFAATGGGALVATLLCGKLIIRYWK